MSLKTIDRHLWQRFWAIAAPYWHHEEKWKAWGLVALLGVLLLGQTRFAVLFNEQTGEFTSALAARDAARFWASIQYCFVLLLMAVPIYAFFYYLRDRLGILWRRWLTDRYLERYLAHRHYYELNGDIGIDNPDQRIAEDINTFTSRSLYFMCIAIGSILQLIAFSAVLWSVSSELVYFLVAYAIFGTVFTVAVFGRPLLALNFMQLRREADFRFGLVRIRENAESIAFYRGESQERRQVRTRFAAAFDNFSRLISRQLFLNLFQYTFSLLTIILPSAIIASRVLSGELEVGRAVQAAGAFAAVLSAVSVIVENFESLSRFAAGIDRLSTFSRSLNAPLPSRAIDGGLIESVEGPSLVLEGLTLLTPGRGRILVSDLSAAIEPGEGLMIVGESGSGKSSLLRAVAGLWNCGSGRIIRPASEHILFLPQRPYMILGSLRNQLLYPSEDRRIRDAELLHLLERVNLADLAERFGGLDVELDWEKVLSVGEQQRLALARVLLSRPVYAVLDEATSALDRANEARLYEELANAATTLISVSHHTTLLKFHKQVLDLAGNGRWKLCSATDYTP